MRAHRNIRSTFKKLLRAFLGVISYNLSHTVEFQIILILICPKNSQVQNPSHVQIKITTNSTLQTGVLIAFRLKSSPQDRTIIQNPILDLPAPDQTCAHCTKVIIPPLRVLGDMPNRRHLQRTKTWKFLPLNVVCYGLH